jgi:hypothetical protein
MAVGCRHKQAGPIPFAVVLMNLYFLPSLLGIAVVGLFVSLPV